MEIIVQGILIIAAGMMCLLSGDYRISCFILFICLIVLYTKSIWRQHDREKQLKEMTMYLMKLQDGMALPELAKCNEGYLGILQSEIYKMVVLLKEQTNAAAKQKNYLAQMLSDISHQIKTPLTAITLMTDLLKEPGLSEEKRLEFAAGMDKQLGKITWLIRNLLTISQLEADVLKLKREEIPVSGLLEKACQPLAVLAELKGVAILLDECPDDIVLNCDEAWTAEAFSNIIKNCIEHTPEGGEIRIAAGQNNLAVNITIWDNGCGIAREDLPHIFERFYKGKHGSKNSVGIGLAMAKQIIYRQDGIISVESTEGEGTIFRIKMYLR